MLVDEVVKRISVSPGTVTDDILILKDYATGCDTVAELGCHIGGGSTWGLIAARPKRVISVDIYFPYQVNSSQLIKAAKEAGVTWNFYLEDSRTVTLPEMDMLFVDTWHSHDQVEAELNQHGDKVMKWIVFHDTKTCAADSGFSPDQVGVDTAIEEFCDRTAWHVHEKHDTQNGMWAICR